MSQVLIMHCKSYDRYFSATTQEELALASLSILKERRKEGYWYREPKLESRAVDSNVQTYLDLTDEEVVSLPAALRERAEKERAKHARILNHNKEEYEADKLWYEEMVRITDLPVEEAVKEVKTFRTSNRTEPMAYFILRARTDYEHERISLEDMVIPNGK